VRTFVASSSAAVYGTPTEVPISEDAPTHPISPYGETKLAVERMLASYARSYGLRFAALRYFNAAGAQPGLAERHQPESHLLPLVLDAAAGLRPRVVVFGGDYPTPDGTCIRDYVHVVDLADGHLAALDYLAAGGESGPFNLGTGRGHSVREVIDMCRAITGKAITVEWGPRREGDPAALVASPRRAEARLRWRAECSSLERIVRDAWSSHRVKEERPHAR
jgi:UDP-glucose-4-epimerase GalE